MNSANATLLAAIMLVMFGAIGLGVALRWQHRAFKIPRLLSLAGLLLALGGFWLAVEQRTALIGWGAVAGWPVVEGTVIESRVAGQRALHPEIVYEYSINGIRYRDTTSFDTPSFGGRNIKADEAEAISNMYAAGTQVAVHYDPANHSVSLIRTSPDWSVYGKLGLSGALFGFGLFLAASALRLSRNLTVRH
jgi:hypothetical protein